MHLLIGEQYMESLQDIKIGLVVKPLRREDWLVYSLTFLPPLVLLLIVAIQPMVPIAYLMKDMLAVAELSKDQCCHVYYGLVSNVGILVWCACAAVCLFSALLLTVSKTEKADIIFLTFAGVLTGWLMLDDFFMVHEDVLPALGISELIAFIVYALLTLAYFASSWRLILKHRFILLVLAISLLGLSVVVDQLIHSEASMRIFIEDSAKLLGICAWSGFHIEAALTTLMSAGQKATAATQPQ